MSTISVPGPKFLQNNGSRNHCKLQRKAACWTMSPDSESFVTRWKEKLSLKLSTSYIQQCEALRPFSDQESDRFQPPDEEPIQDDRDDDELEQFEAREAASDEEYFTAAWLRAETQWEDKTNQRYAESFKKRFIDQEFNAIKRRSKAQIGDKCICIVMVKKEEKDVKRTVLESVVGTLDLSIQNLLHGQTFPQGRLQAHLFCNIYNKTDSIRYGYVCNLCVAKPARRLGVASSMLCFAIETAKAYGAQRVYVLVNRNNKPAQELYQKLGFQMVEEASSQLVEEQTYLLCLEFRDITITSDTNS